MTLVCISIDESPRREFWCKAVQDGIITVCIINQLFAEQSVYAFEKPRNYYFISIGNIPSLCQVYWSTQIE